jgi:indolepyruvate ferredoxin oxidoreductase beta subunit
VHSRTYNVLFAGVGGQGVLLAAEIAAMAVARAGFEVKQTEVHGVSQRGGSVETHLRFGQTVWSPVITPGQADFVVGMEKLEALRFGHFVNPNDGLILINDHEIIPASIADAESKYPHNAIEFLQENGYNILVMMATKIAHELGDGRMANVVMVGAMSNYLPITSDIWLDTLQQRIPEKYREENLRAFQAGLEVAEKSKA